MKIKLTISALLFYVAYIMWIVLYILNRTYYSDMFPVGAVSKIIRILVYTLLFVKILYDNIYSIKTILGASLIVLAFMISMNSGEFGILDMALFVYCVGNVPIRNLVKLTLFIQLFMMIFIVLSSFSGIILNEIWYRDDGMPRYALGYRYCTYIANYYFHSVLMYIYLKNKNKFKVKELAIVLFINYMIYSLTDTRAVFYLICFAVILAYGINFLKKPLKDGICNRIVFEYCFPISAIMSIFISINYNGSNDFYVILNKLFSTRLILGQNAYKEFGISLLGQKITWFGGRAGIERGLYDIYNFVDCSYLNIAINYGLIILILLCVGFVFIGKNAIIQDEKSSCIILFFLAIHSMTDPQLIELGYHPFLLMFGAFLNSSIKNISMQKKYINRKIQLQ